jgi:hypothetical protein
MRTLYDIGDVARELHIPRSTLHRRWQAGELPLTPYRNGKGWPLWSEAGLTAIAVKFAAQDHAEQHIRQHRAGEE